MLADIPLIMLDCFGAVVISLQRNKPALLQSQIESSAAAEKADKSSRHSLRDHELVCRDWSTPIIGTKSIWSRALEPKWNSTLISYARYSNACPSRTSQGSGAAAQDTWLVPGEFGVPRF